MYIKICGVLFLEEFEFVGLIGDKFRVNEVMSDELVTF